MLEAIHSDDDIMGEEDSVGMTFSQAPPEISQDIYPVKAGEKRNLDNLAKQERTLLLETLSRHLLFKALAGEPIDRLKCCKEAGITGDQGKISSAAFAEASERLRNVFGFELKRIPVWLETCKSTPKKYSERYYVITSALDSRQSRSIYGVHTEASAEKGFLMVVLALAFCMGDSRPDGSRWILDADLYRMLNSIDENIPPDPPLQGPAGKKSACRRHIAPKHGSGLSLTPDTDALLKQFVEKDYLLKERIPDDKQASIPDADENSFVYAVGPRSAIEIGRAQIIHFCAEVLDEPLGSTMP